MYAVFGLIYGVLFACHNIEGPVFLCHVFSIVIRSFFFSARRHCGDGPSLLCSRGRVPTCLSPQARAGGGFSSCSLVCSEPLGDAGAAACVVLDVGRVSRIQSAQRIVDWLFLCHNIAQNRALSKSENIPFQFFSFFFNLVSSFARVVSQAIVMCKVVFKL